METKKIVFILLMHGCNPTLSDWKESIDQNTSFDAEIVELIQKYEIIKKIKMNSKLNNISLLKTLEPK